MQPSLKNRYAEQNVIDVTENKHRFVANNVDFSDCYIRCGVPIIGRQHCRLTICIRLVEVPKKAVKKAPRTGASGAF